MSYAVTWNPLATQRIDEAWAVADPRQQERIANGVDKIQRQLRTSPLTAGESRGSEIDRVVSRSPITVYYLVDARHRLVRVIAAVVYGPPRE